MAAAAATTTAAPKQNYLFLLKKIEKPRGLISNFLKIFL
jgi:hypothetical protein